MAARCRLTLKIVLILVCSPATALAGPPYTTDDPEPVEYRHWELYLASQVGHDKTGWAGTGPHIEANYGVLAPSSDLLEQAAATSSPTR